VRARDAMHGLTERLWEVVGGEALLRRFFYDRNNAATKMPRRILNVWVRHYPALRGMPPLNIHTDDSSFTAILHLWSKDFRHARVNTLGSGHVVLYDPNKLVFNRLQQFDNEGRLFRVTVRTKPGQLLIYDNPMEHTVVSGDEGDRLVVVYFFGAGH
jgi:hypothetical protein